MHLKFTNFEHFFAMRLRYFKLKISFYCYTESCTIELNKYKNAPDVTKFDE